MTLLVDRVRTDKALKRMASDPEAADIVKWFKSDYLPVYEISNVAEYLKSSGADFGSMDDFPNVGPPHVAYWMEWFRPERLVSFNVAHHPERVAVLFWQAGPPENGVWKMGVHAWGMWRHNRPEPLASWEMEFSRNAFPVILETHVFPGISNLFLEDHVSSSHGDPFVPNVASIEEAKRLIEENQKRLEDAKRDLAETESKLDECLEVWVRLAVLHPTLMAHSLLACKNVDTIDNAPVPKLSKNFHKRHGKFLMSFKTLKVSAMGGKQHATGSGLGADKRLHIMRGHFKTFTAQRPLFGRVVGTYWWSPGLRGNAKRGAVVKDYSVKVRTDASV